MLKAAADGSIVDADLAASFTVDGRSLLYRTGPAGARTLMLLDLASGAIRAVATERALAALLATRVGQRAGSCWGRSATRMLTFLADGRSSGAKSR